MFSLVSSKFLAMRNITLYSVDHYFLIFAKNKSLVIITFDLIFEHCQKKDSSWGNLPTFIWRDWNKKYSLNLSNLSFTIAHFSTFFCQIRRRGNSFVATQPQKLELESDKKVFQHFRHHAAALTKNIALSFHCSCI